jgi:hypothetical protein
MFLALGTAVFKPGIQGTLILATNRRNSSVAWGVFYQTVNIGGWLGPLIALHMRQSSWSLVFYTNAAFICFNLILLLTYKEPGIEVRLARRALVKAGKVREKSLFRESLQELRKPHLYLYLLIFSLWWFMFPMIWDVLPKYVEDWVDTGAIVNTLFGSDGTRSGVAHFLLGMKEDGMSIEPEGIVNINSGMIMLTCFLFAGRHRSVEPCMDLCRRDGRLQHRRNARQSEIQRIHRQYRPVGQESDVDWFCTDTDPGGPDLGGQTRAATLSHVL